MQAAHLVRDVRLIREFSRLSHPVEKLRENLVLQHQAHQLQLPFLVIQAEHPLAQSRKPGQHLPVFPFLLEKPQVSARVVIIIGLPDVEVHQLRDLLAGHGILVQVLQKRNHPLHGIGLNKGDLRPLHGVVRPHRRAAAHRLQLLQRNGRILQGIILHPHQLDGGIILRIPEAVLEQPVNHIGVHAENQADGLSHLCPPEPVRVIELPHMEILMDHVLRFHNHHRRAVFKAAVDLALGVLHMDPRRDAPDRVHPEVKGSRSHPPVESLGVPSLPQEIIQNA